MTADKIDANTPDLLGPDASLLIVDDDAPFLRRLARAMESRGFQVETAESVAEGIASAPEAFLGLLKGRNFGKQLVKLV